MGAGSDLSGLCCAFRKPPGDADVLVLESHFEDKELQDMSYLRLHADT